MDTQACLDPPRATVQVWDPLVRLCHWTLAVGFIAAFLTEEGDLGHRVAGYAAAGAVLIRLVWGFVGSVHARFSSFVPGPSQLVSHLIDMLNGRDRRYVGHNPAAGAMALTLLGLVSVLGVTGWMLTTNQYYGQDWLELVHEGAAYLGLLLVCAHVAGAFYESVRHGENLPWAMVTGRKRP